MEDMVSSKIVTTLFQLMEVLTYSPLFKARTNCSREKYQTLAQRRGLVKVGWQD